MNGISLRRRIGIACAALLLAAGLFRGQVASALVTRGDDALRAGDTSGLRFYARALALDPTSARAADRLAFALAMRRSTHDAEAAIDVATAALDRLPDDGALLADRGFAEQRLARWAAAERDFGRAGAVDHDARYDHLAGRVALKLDDRRTARRYFALALRHDPRFEPARAALASLP